MRNLVLADNQEITRYGMKLFCSIKPELGNVLEVTNRESLVQTLLAYPSSLVVLDYTLFDLNSVDDLHILESRFPDTSWLLFSSDLSEDFIKSLWIRTSSVSWISKESSVKEIGEALETVLKGQRFFQHQCEVMVPPSEDRELPKESELPEPLTATEKEILKAIALGKTTKEVASERFLSVYTVMTHRKNIFRKLHVNNVHEATKFAMRAGIVDMAEYCI